MRFTEKVVIVTGAGSGIGKATAERFLDEGASVVLVGRHKDKLAAVAKPYPADKTLLVECDVSSDKDVDALVAQAADTFERIDVLVNNAGVIARATSHHFRRTIGEKLWRPTLTVCFLPAVRRSHT